MTLFKENNEYSWRKIMTSISCVLFAFSVIGYEIQHNFDELPGSYQAIISGVFGFYFMKSFFRNIATKQ